MNGRVTRAARALPGAVRRRLVLWGPVAAWMTVIFVLSSLSAPRSPVPANDKVQHFVGYGILGALAVRATAGGRLTGVTMRAAAAAWAIATAYGVTDEYHQNFVPERSPEAADIAADALGAGAAVAAVWAFGIIDRSRRPAGAPPRRR